MSERNIIEVRLFDLKDGAYMLKAKDGTIYAVPMGAFTMVDGLIIAVDATNYIKICLSDDNKSPSSAEYVVPTSSCSTKSSTQLSLTDSPIPSCITESNTPTSSKKKWFSNCVKNLLHHYKEHCHLFRSTSIKADDVWKQIQSKMIEDGFNFSTEQIKTKFSKLKQNFLKVRDNNSQTGASPMDFPWMEEFESIFAGDHDVSPIATASSSTFQPLKEQKKENIIPKNSQKTNIDKILGHMESMQRERALRQEQRDKERREERQEILNAMRLSNELYQKIFCKLVDKK